MFRRVLPGICILHTAERRDVLGCTSPKTERFPKARGKSRCTFNSIHPDSRQCTAILPSLIHRKEISVDRVKPNTSLVMMRECSIGEAYSCVCSCPQMPLAAPSSVQMSPDHSMIHGGGQMTGLPVYLSRFFFQQW